MFRFLDTRVSSYGSRAGKALSAAALIFAAAACGSTAPTAPSPAILGTPSSSTPVSGGTTSPGVPTANGAIVLDAGNPTCADLAAQYAPGATWFEVRIDRAPNASDALADAALSVAITNGTTKSFDWSANRGVDAVLVKSGSMGNSFYLYAPEVSSASGMTTPGSVQDISHISFCYDVELLVSKTAATTFTRDYDWTIAESVDRPSITLENGAQATVNYSVAVRKNTGTDSNWAVSGTISVTNPHPAITATGIAVSESVPDRGTVAATCPSNTLAPGASMTCSYGPISLPNGSARTTVSSGSSTTYGIAQGLGTAAVSFVSPTTVLDNSVNVTDAFAGVLGTLTSSYTYTFPRTIAASSLVCGANTLNDTASLATDDGLTRTASASVIATLSCSTATLPPPPPPPAPPVVTGCAYSQGYWGSHSSKGPAPYNSTWAKIGEDTPFYSSGHSYYAQMQTPSKGNAYNILAAQFIAATLNMLSGADAPAAVDLTAIDTFYKTYTPAQIDALKGNDPVRKQALDWASTLESYNNGRLNVSHCG